VEESQDLDFLTPQRRPARASGGRTWWAHLELTRINTAPTFLRKKIEENPDILWTEAFSGRY
jgi:hypothetical protein